jgi:nucleotide-binding universal stress UspA family protein
LTLVNVAPTIPHPIPRLQKSLQRLLEDQLSALIETAEIEEVELQTKVLLGTPFLEIIKEVACGGYDLVIKSAEGGGGLASRLFGSTDLHLMRKCPCPVWIIKPSTQEPYARVLAAVDPDPAEAANAELNTLILELAGSLARSEHSELHVVHTWSMLYESMLNHGRARLPREEMKRLVNDSRKAHKQWFDELMGQHDLHDLSVKTHLLKGEPGDVIPVLAQEERVELIVMGTVARTGIPGFFIGNTAERILDTVDCSVLAVKPRGFTTPVQT